MSIDAPEAPARRAEPQIFSGNGRRKPDGKKEPAAEVGWFLAREREKHGITIDEAGEVTGIHPYHIEAIETGDLTHMPPRLEAVEMIAGYAQYLGFDAEPLIAHLITFLPPPPITREPYHPASPPVLSSAKILSFGKLPKVPNFSVRIPGGTGGVVTSLAVALLLYGGFHMFGGSSSVAPKPAVEEIAQVDPPQASAADMMPTASTSPDAADITSPEKPISDDALVGGLPSPDENDALGALIAQTEEPAVKAKPKKPVAETKTATAEIPEPNQGKVYGAENADARIVLKATAPVWLRIEDGNGTAIMTQMLNTGDSYRVPDKPGLVALSRDGGRINFIIDGKVTGVLGPAGKILISEKLDVASLQAKK